MKSLHKEELKEILIKNWMTHDGMWFFHCVKNCGVLKANKINKAAVKSMAKIELKRLKKLFNIDKIEKFKDFQNFLDFIFDVVKAKFMDFTYEFPSKNELNFIMNKCFAYDGIKRIGIIDQYECGIIERLKGWFEELGIKYTITPQINGCMMHKNGECFRNFKFSLQ
jgi:hypothetical protein